MCGIFNVSKAASDLTLGEQHTVHASDDMREDNMISLDITSYLITSHHITQKKVV